MPGSLTVPNVRVRVAGRAVTVQCDQAALLADAGGVHAVLRAAAGQVGLVAAAAAAAGVRVDLRQKGGGRSRADQPAHVVPVP